MYACDNSFLEVAKYLIDLMEDVNHLSTSRSTALDIALNQALYMRQIQLRRWLVDGILHYNKSKQVFQAHGPFDQESLRSRDLIRKDVKGMEALFQIPYTESDRGQ